MFQAATPLTGHWYIMSVTMSFSHGTKWYLPYVGQGFPGGSVGKESACNMGDLGSIPGSGRSPGEGNSYLLQYSGLENSMDCIVHKVAKSWTRLSDFQFHFQEEMSYQAMKRRKLKCILL